MKSRQLLALASPSLKQAGAGLLLRGGTGAQGRLHGAPSRLTADTRSRAKAGPFLGGTASFPKYTVLLNIPCQVSQDESIQTHIKLLWCIHTSVLKYTKMKDQTHISSPADGRHSAPKCSVRLKGQELCRGYTRANFQYSTAVSKSVFGEQAAC